jgi:PAS domain S-box-containing protein
MGDLTGEQLFQALGDNAYELDREFRFLTYNEGCATYYGKPVEAALGVAFWDVFPESRGTQLEQLLRTAMTNRRAVRVEMAGVVRPERWVEVTAFPTTRGLGVAFRERTSEHRAIEALRSSEERLRYLLMTLDLGVFMARDLDGTIRFWSAGCTRLYGWTPDEAVGHSAPALLRTTFPVPLSVLQSALKRDGEWTGDLRHRTKDGRELIVTARVVMRRDARDQPGAVLEASTDVTAQRAAEAALRESEARLRVAIEAARFSTWEFDTRRGVGSRRGDLTRTIPELPETGFGFADWMALIHPNDRPAVEAAFMAVVHGLEERAAAEFRVCKPDGTWSWVASSGAAVERDPVTGEVLRLAGVAHDVTERRLADERQRLLAGEVDHRAKNALAVVQAALRLTIAMDVPSYRRALEGRVGALARAQTLLADDRWSGADLRVLLNGELAPFLGSGGPGPRVDLHGQRVTLPPGAAQPLAMAVHELATNAVKHGALSVPAGRVSVSWHIEQEPDGLPLLRLRWAESGGPPVAGTPERHGFGSRVLDGTVRHQLGGTVALAWEAQGLTCEVAVPLRPRSGSDAIAGSAVH